VRLAGVAAAVVLAVVLSGCGCSSPVPSGAQLLHVVVGPNDIRLNPATVHAGDVYITLDVPCTAVGFAWRAQGSVEIAPLSDDDVARLQRGDLQGTGSTGFNNSDCTSPAPNQDGLRVGECGNTQNWKLIKGRYAFFLHGPDGITPSAVTILEVAA